jgi:hypothetical protein
MRADAVRFVIAAALAAFPCLLLPFPQLGDLHTHLYNGWLAGQLDSPNTPAALTGCFYLVPMWTNTLLDRLLTLSVPLLGPAASARAAALLTVCCFFLSVFLWQRVTLGRWPLVFAPLLLALTYGWLLRAGFLNYLLALGFAFAAAACLRLPRYPRLALIFTLSILGLLAHAIAFFLAAGLLLTHHYFLAARRTLAVSLFVVATVSLLVLRLFLVQSSFGSPEFSLFASLGLTAFGGGGIAAAMLPCATLALVITRLRRWSPLLLTALLAVAAAFLIPAEISLPQIPRPMSYNTVRLATLAWIFLFTAAEHASLPRWLTVFTLPMSFAALAFFYQEQLWLGGLHRGVQAATRSLPPGSRVVLQSRQGGSSVDGILHMIDSACIGHCYSLANYVPASQHFRIRRQEACTLSLSAPRLVEAENGRFVVLPTDLPLWRIRATAGPAFEAVPMRGGESLELQILTR